MDESIQEFIDAYYQAYSKAGREFVWEVVEEPEVRSWSVVELTAEGEHVSRILSHWDEDVARWVALAHNAAAQIVENIQVALDRAEEMERQRDAAVARQLELEVEALDA